MQYQASLTATTPSALQMTQTGITRPRPSSRRSAPTACWRTSSRARGRGPGTTCHLGTASERGACRGSPGDPATLRSGARGCAGTRQQRCRSGRPGRSAGSCSPRSDATGRCRCQCAHRRRRAWRNRRSRSDSRRVLPLVHVRRSRLHPRRLLEIVVLVAQRRAERGPHVAVHVLDQLVAVFATRANDLVEVADDGLVVVVDELANGQLAARHLDDAVVPVHCSSFCCLGYLRAWTSRSYFAALARSSSSSALSTPLRLRRLVTSSMSMTIELAISNNARACSVKRSTRSSDAFILATTLSAALATLIDACSSSSFSASTRARYSSAWRSRLAAA